MDINLIKHFIINMLLIFMATSGTLPPGNDPLPQPGDTPQWNRAVAERLLADNP